MTRPTLKPRTLEQLTELDRLDDELAVCVADWIKHGSAGTMADRERAIRAELERLRPEWGSLQYAKERTDARRTDPVF